MELLKVYTDIFLNKYSNVISVLFVYGSFATGTQNVNSDIDSFIITKSILTTEEKEEIKLTAIQVQHKLGLKPDFKYPVEIFSYDECLDLLNEDYFLKWAGGGFIEQESDDSLEILRAILSNKIVVFSKGDLGKLILKSISIYNKLVHSFPCEEEYLDKFFKVDKDCCV